MAWSFLLEGAYEVALFSLFQSFVPRPAYHFADDAIDFIAQDRIPRDSQSLSIFILE